MANRNYLLACEVDQRIEDERVAHKCSERMINGCVSGYCAGCHHYYPCDQLCEVRNDVIQGLNESSACKELGI
jgi:hypothetical protein